MSRFFAAIACAGVALGQFAEPPGPLQVTIRAPGEVSRTEAPVTVRVMLANETSEAIRGNLRLRVIDRWRVEPSTPVPFEVRARGTASLSFTATAGEGTFNAQYPVHAIAEYETGGQRRVAHPVHLVSVRSPNPPRALLPVEWGPVRLAANRAIGLWRQPLARVLTTAVGQEIPVGNPPAICLWQRGTYRSGGAARSEPFPVTEDVQFGVRIERGGWREAVAMRLGPRQPSGRERVERIAVEFPVELPASQPVQLRFALAAAGGNPAQVTSRVRVIPFDEPAGEPGTAVFETRTAGPTWAEGRADLSRFAGRKVRVQLESASSQAAQLYWAEPTLAAGQPPTPAAFPPAPGASPRSLGVVEQAGARYDVLLFPGRRGLLDSTVAFTGGGKRLLFHGFRVRVAGDALEDWRSAGDLLEVREEASNGRYRVRHRFGSWVGSFDLLGELSAARGALQARFWLENAPAPRPWLPVYIEDVAAGPWSERATRIYAGHGNVVVDPKAFELDSNGHKLASSFVGFDFAGGISVVQAVDVPPEILKVEPETRDYSLHSPHAQTVSFIPGPTVWHGAKVWRQINGLRASSGVPALAGRFVIDLWGGGGRDVPGGLAKAFRYGMTDSMVITHSWQRPFDPQSPGPGDKVALEIARLCRANGVLFAPHDNYIDFYPDADFPGNPFLRFPTLEHARPGSRTFSYEDIVFTRHGEPLKAWFLESINAQSYRARPDRVMDAVKEKWRWMKMAGATANFIDVYSSESVYDFYTWDGQFVDRLKTRQQLGAVFDWIRRYTDNGPQTSEAGHDQLVGWVDGATAIHLRVDAARGGMVIRIGCADSERIPWMDAVHHDRFVMHGAGYEDRYATGLDTRAHGVYSDDYITTEVLTGHVANAQQAFGRDVVRKYWLLHDLMRGIALRNMDAFEFAGNDIHRQHVRWDNGGEFWVNRGKEEWLVNGHSLPEYGFYARAPSANGPIEAAIERRDGVIVEWAASPASVFVNARPLVPDAEEANPRRLAPSGPDPRPARMNPEGKPIPFPVGATDGGFRLVRENGSVVLTPLPSSPRFTARLRWNALPWKTAAPARAEALDENGRALRTVQLGREGNEIILRAEPDVFAYRLK